MKIYNPKRINPLVRMRLRKPFQFRGLFEFADQETGETFKIQVQTWGGDLTPYELIEQYCQSLLVTAGMLEAGATTVAGLNGKSEEFPKDLPGPDLMEPLLIEHDTTQDRFTDDQITFYQQGR